jgi:hypothetical protein
MPDGVPYNVGDNAREQLGYGQSVSNISRSLSDLAGSVTHLADARVDSP